MSLPRPSLLAQSSELIPGLAQPIQSNTRPFFFPYPTPRFFYLPKPPPPTFRLSKKASVALSLSPHQSHFTCSFCILLFVSSSTLSLVEFITVARQV
ncbi:hypothetical protein K461DRAFT_78996 [Myriangium duriaei CBS 260.36]|uniref:Uncharacterized protein n=1 Tax=Myriangium duriaei CBS 260.36 TaxID=1168546 RepID=A0A9P4J590_9PEZI|nr:hypothetical protein K461DRAFT_78996 [Myriangium duriaei CBS 260.36]